MSRRDDARDRLPPDVEDDVEILEVVGLDEDAPPGSARDVDDDEHEIDVVFDDGSGNGEDGGDVSSPVEDAGTEAGSDDARERLLRLQAEFENFKKRVEREKEEFYVHAAAHLVDRLLPVLDNFDRAILHATEDPATGGPFLDGVRLIHKQLMDELSRQGLRPVEAVGTPFDPERHEAVATEPRDDREPNTILMEFQRGYFFRDRLLRPALVQVSVEPPESDDGPGDDDGHPARDGEGADGAGEA